MGGGNSKDTQGSGCVLREPRPRERATPRSPPWAKCFHLKQTNKKVHAYHLPRAMKTQHGRCQGQTETPSQQEGESMLHLETSAGSKQGGRSGLPCDHRDWSIPTTSRTLPLHSMKAPWGGADAWISQSVPKREVIQVYADQVPGSHEAACHWGDGGLTGAQGSAQNRAGLEDGACAQASRPASWCVRVCAPVLLWVCVSLMCTINSEQVVFTKQAGGKGLFKILPNRALPVATPMVPASENHSQGTNRPPRSL